MNADLMRLLLKPWLAVVVLSWQLAGCGTAPLGKQIDRLQQTPVCCKEFSEFEVQPMTLDLPMKLWFGEGAQAFVFDGENKSYLHALRLPEGGNYYISLQSYFNGKSYRYFKPRIMTFDAGWQIVEDVVPALEEVPGTVVVDHFMRAQVRLQREAVYLVLTAAKPASPRTPVRSQGGEISNAHWTGSTALPGVNGISYKNSPEGRVVIAARTYQRPLD